MTSKTKFDELMEARRERRCQMARDHGLDPDIVFDNDRFAVEYRSSVDGPEYVLCFEVLERDADQLPERAVIRRVHGGSRQPVIMSVEVPYRGEWPPQW